MSIARPKLTAVRHGIPEDNSYVFDYANDPGLATSEENSTLLEEAVAELVRRIDENSKVAIATSSTRRTRETAEALWQHPVMRPFIVGEVTPAYDLSEQALANTRKEDRSLFLMATLHRLAGTAFQGMEDSSPHLIVVSHDSVIGHLGYMHSNQEPKTGHMAVNHFF